MGINSAYFDFYNVYKYIDRRKFNIISIDMLGSGFSSCPKRKVRSVENISSELECLLDCLNLKKYIVVSHSFNSMYWLYAFNNYKFNPMGFVGIDPSTPQIMNLYKKELQNNLIEAKNSKSNVEIIDTDINPNLPDNVSKISSELYSKISGNKYEISELEESLFTINKCLDFKISSDIPSLSILSTLNYDDYKALGNPYFNDNVKSMEIVLNGHHFLQWIYPKRISYLLTLFIDELYD